MFAADTTPLDELESQIAELAAHIWAASARLLILLAEFDRREGWTGFLSCAHWLSWRCGLAPSGAREHVRVARALVALPRIIASFPRGELSYSKVRAITRIATPENEDLLLEWSRHGSASQIERLVRSYRQTQNAQAEATT